MFALQHYHQNTEPMELHASYTKDVRTVVTYVMHDFCTAHKPEFPTIRHTSERYSTYYLHAVLFSSTVQYTAQAVWQCRVKLSACMWTPPLPCSTYSASVSSLCNEVGAAVTKGITQQPPYCQLMVLCSTCISDMSCVWCVCAVQ
jgi:hypothetical protein